LFPHRSPAGGGGGSVAEAARRWNEFRRHGAQEGWSRFPELASSTIAIRTSSLPSFLVFLPLAGTMLLLSTALA